MASLQAPPGEVPPLHGQAAVLTPDAQMKRDRPARRFPFVLATAPSFAAAWSPRFAAFVPGCQSYDVLVQKDQVTQQKFADLQAQLQRRADLVPNLVATVKASAKHEEDTLDEVTKARAAATGIQIAPGDLDDPQKMKAFQDAQNQLSGALSKLLVVNEAYPDLKANAAYHDLQIQLEGIPRTGSCALARSTTPPSATSTRSSARSAGKS